MARRVKATFWGTRGSVASAGRHTAKYGGNTVCTAIEYGGNIIICDAGTGIRQLGDELKKLKRPLRATILLSHLHWDHVVGLPFFLPLYMPRNRILIAGPGHGGRSFKSTLSGVMAPPYFPITPRDFTAKVEFRTVGSKKFRVDKISVEPFSCYHPGGSVGWKFIFPGGKKLVYVSDNEPSLRNREQMLSWMHRADLVIHDAQYSPAQYGKHRGWGHSPYTYAVQMAIAAEVERLILYHYDPSNDDKKLENWLRDARNIVRRYRSRLKVDLSREGRAVVL